MLATNAGNSTAPCGPPPGAWAGPRRGAERGREGARTEARTNLPVFVRESVDPPRPSIAQNSLPSGIQVLGVTRRLSRVGSRVSPSRPFTRSSSARSSARWATRSSRWGDGLRSIPGTEGQSRSIWHGSPESRSALTPRARIRPRGEEPARRGYPPHQFRDGPKRTPRVRTPGAPRPPAHGVRRTLEGGRLYRHSTENHAALRAVDETHSGGWKAARVLVSSNLLRTQGLLTVRTPRTDGARGGCCHGHLSRLALYFNPTGLSVRPRQVRRASPGTGPPPKGRPPSPGSRALPPRTLGAYPEEAEDSRRGVWSTS